MAMLPFFIIYFKSCGGVLNGYNFGNALRLFVRNNADAFNMAAYDMTVKPVT